MKISKCMTKDVITVNEATGIKEAAALLVNNRITSMPVVDDQGSIIGIISLSNIIDVFLPDFVSLVDIDFVKDYGTLELSPEDVKKIASMYVGKVMTKDVCTVDEKCSLIRALSMFEKHNIRALPVVKDKKLVGIVSTVDVCRRFLEVWEGKVQEKK